MQRLFQDQEDTYEEQAGIYQEQEEGKEINLGLERSIRGTGKNILRKVKRYKDYFMIRQEKYEEQEKYIKKIQRLFLGGGGLFQDQGQTYQTQAKKSWISRPQESVPVPHM